MCLHQAVVL